MDQGEREQEIRISDLRFIRRGPYPIVLPLGFYVIIVIIRNREIMLARHKDHEHVKAE